MHGLESTDYTNFFSGGDSMNNHNEYSIFTIADWFLHNTICDQKKLQKLCYYAQAWNLALRKHNNKGYFLPKW